MEEESKIREYLRIISTQDKPNLNKLYKTRKNTRRNGFLTLDHVERLTGNKRWERDTSNDDISKYFSEIREKAYAAFLDFEILCSVLTESQLEKIFTKSDKDVYPISEVLSSLLPIKSSAYILRESINQLKNTIESAKIDRETFKNNPNEVERLTNWIKHHESELIKKQRELPKQEKKLKEQEWRKFILEDVALQVLKWYLSSGIFKTDSHQRMILDMMDAITIMSSGKKMNFRRDLEQIDVSVYKIPESS